MPCWNGLNMSGERRKNMFLFRAWNGILSPSISDMHTFGTMTSIIELFGLVVYLYSLLQALVLVLVLKWMSLVPKSKKTWLFLLNSAKPLLSFSSGKLSHHLVIVTCLVQMFRVGYLAIAMQIEVSPHYYNISDHLHVPFTPSSFLNNVLSLNVQFLISCYNTVLKVWLGFDTKASWFGIGKHRRA